LRGGEGGGQPCSHEARGVAGRSNLHVSGAVALSYFYYLLAVGVRVVLHNMVVCVRPMCDQIKEELIYLLIHSDRKYYDLTALAEHQAAVAAKKMAALEAANPATGKARKTVY